MDVDGGGGKGKGRGGGGVGNGKGKGKGKGKNSQKQPGATTTTGWGGGFGGGGGAVLLVLVVCLEEVGVVAAAAAAGLRSTKRQRGRPARVVLRWTPPGRDTWILPSTRPLHQEGQPRRRMAKRTGRLEFWGHPRRGRKHGAASALSPLLHSVRHVPVVSRVVVVRKPLRAWLNREEKNLAVSSRSVRAPKGHSAHLHMWEVRVLLLGSVVRPLSASAAPRWVGSVLPPSLD